MLTKGKWRFFFRRQKSETRSSSLHMHRHALLPLSFFFTRARTHVYTELLTQPVWYQSTLSDVIASRDKTFVWKKSVPCYKTENAFLLNDVAREDPCHFIRKFMNFPFALSLLLISLFLICCLYFLSLFFVSFIFYIFHFIFSLFLFFVVPACSPIFFFIFSEH